MKPRPTSARAGFSLVLSLIILTLLAILVVGFLSSTAMDRTTAHAFADKAKAETAASTAVNQAISTLREYIAQYPDSATMWEKLTPSGGGPVVEGTMLYYYDLPPPNGYDPSSLTGTPTRHIIPLMSGGTDTVDATGQPFQVTDKAKALGLNAWHESFWKNGKITSEPDCVDLNRPQFNDDKKGWIGAAPDGRKPYYAKWIEVKENSEPKGKTIGRYAFWMEDESFKVNLNLLDRNERDTELMENARLKTDNLTSNPLPPQIAALVPVQGLLRSARTSTVADRPTVAVGVKSLRESFLGKRLLDLSSFNQVNATFVDAAGKPALVGEESKFLATIFSGGLNVSRHGSQRLSLNGLGFDKRFDDKTALPDKELQDGIDRLVAAERYHVPKFPERFFRLSANPSPADLNEEQVKKRQGTKGINYSDIYFYKVAANIRDYIDPDPQPTVIMEGGFVRTRQPPISALPDYDGPTLNNVWAQGKDTAPFIQEAVARYRSSVNLATHRYELKVDYYIEFWNMTDTDLTVDQLGTSPVLKVVNQLGWVDLSTGESLKVDSGLRPLHNKDRATVLDLKNGVFRNGSVEQKGVRFPPRTCTVITSDPDYATTPAIAAKSPAFSGGYNLSNIYYCSVDPRTGGSPTRKFVGPLSNTSTGIRPVFLSQQGTQTPQDYETEIFLSNDTGFLEFQAAALSHGGYEPGTGHIPSSPSKDDTKRDYAVTRDDWYGGSLIGNNRTPSQLSDPRTNSEAIIFTRYNGGISEPDQSRYFNDTDTPRFSLGYQNTRYGSPPINYKWPDYYRGWDDTSANTNKVEISANCPAPVYIANAPLTSIGQLGDVFDPARVQGIVGTLQVEGARGGGRTFRIGQQDDRVDHSVANPPSRAWASWRLCDFLSTSNELVLPGLVNINGVTRDNGAALRAACFKLNIQSVTRTTGSPSTLRNGSVAFDSEEVTDKAKPGLNYLISQILQRYATNGPFSERGEISELAAFNTGSGLLPVLGSTSTAQDMAIAFDRTREELVRRLLELITTRGNVFSVYALGQAITDGPRGKIATATHRLKVTFQLVPKLNTKRPDGSDFHVTNETFDPKKTDPKDVSSVTSRFAKPDQYDIQILQVSS